MESKMSEEKLEKEDELLEMFKKMTAKDLEKLVKELECLEKPDVAKSQTTNATKTTDNDKN